MNAHLRQPGGVTVGMLDDQPWFEATVIRYFRLWGDGPEGQDRVQYEYLAQAGPDTGPMLVAAWAEMIAIFASYRRRPLLRHATDCRCVGADEACFALFMATAAHGEEEDALMTALLMVRADMAPLVTQLARQVGLGLRQARLQMQPQPIAAPPRARLH